MPSGLGLRLGLPNVGGGGLDYFTFTADEEDILVDAVSLDSGQKPVAVEMLDGDILIGVKRNNGGPGTAQVQRYVYGSGFSGGTNLRINVPDDTHDIPTVTYDSVEDRIYTTHSIHNLFDYFQIWRSSDDTPGNIGSPSNIAGSSNTYQYVFANPAAGGEVMVLSREDSSSNSHWSLYFASDVDLGDPYWERSGPFLTGNYTIMIPAKDGTGMWVLTRPSSSSHSNRETDGSSGPGYSYTPWTNAHAVYFLRWSDHALLHADRTTVEVADVFAGAAGSQEFNPCGLNYLAAPQTLNNATGWTTNGDRTLQSLVNAVSADGFTTTAGVFSARATDEPNSHYWRQLSTDMHKAMVAGERYTLSMRLRENTLSKVRIYIGAGNYAAFDLSAGTVIESSGDDVISSEIAAIHDDGSGVWYRCSLTAEPGAGNIDFIQWALLDAGGSVSFDPNNTTSGVLWDGAMLHEGDPIAAFDFVTDYHSVALPTQRPTLWEIPDGYYMSRWQVEEVVEGFLEVCWCEIRLAQGVASGTGPDNEDESYWYYGRFNLSTGQMTGKVALCTTGDGHGSGAPNSAWLFSPVIMGVGEVVLSTTNEGGGGENYLSAFRIQGSTVTRTNLKSSPTDVFFYPIGVKRVTADGGYVPTRKLWYGRADSITDDETWSSDMSYMALEPASSLVPIPSIADYSPLIWARPGSGNFTLDGSSRVTEWANEGSDVSNFTVRDGPTPDTTERPTLSTDNVGRACPLFGLTDDDNLELTLATERTDPFMIVMVWNSGGSSLARWLCDAVFTDDASPSTTDPRHIFKQESGTFDVYDGSGWDEIVSSGIGNNEWHYVVYYVDPSNVANNFAKVDGATAVTGIGTADGIKSLSLGGWGGGTSAEWIAEIAEVAVIPIDTGTQTPATVASEIEALIANSHNL